MTQTPNLGLDYLVQGQANAETTLNSNVFNYLDAFLCGREAEAEQNDPPGSPATGAVYLVGDTPTGDWASQAGNIAFYFAGWHYLPKKAGFRLFIKDVGLLKIYNGTAWVKQPVLAANDSLEVITRLLTSIETGLTADANKDQANALQLNADKLTHVIATVAATNNAVKLPTANQKELHLVVNHGANDLQVFPASGESIERLATDAATVIPPGKTALFIATASDNWGISLGGGGAGGITNSSFSEKGELLVGSGASAFSVLQVPTANSGSRLLFTDGTKALAWEHPNLVSAQIVDSPDSPTVSADSKTWLVYETHFVKGPGVSFNASKGRFEIDASTYPNLAGNWIVKGMFYCESSTGVIDIGMQHWSGSGSISFTEVTRAKANLSGGQLVTIPIIASFTVITGEVNELGFSVESGNAPHGGSSRNLFNKLFLERVFPNS